MIKRVVEYIKNKKQYFLVGIVIILIIVGIVINNIPKGQMISGSSMDEPEKEKKRNYTVWLKGEIVNPNTYYYEEEMYLFEIINNAGGLTIYSNVYGLNLIEKINSDCVINIAKNENISERNDINIINYSVSDDYSYLYIENTYDIYIFDSYVTYEEIFWRLNLDNSIYNLNLKECINEDLYLKEKKALLNINKATYEDLVNLGVLSNSVINNIIEFIDTNGSIDDIDELDSISGIGEKTLEKLLSLICFK